MGSFIGIFVAVFALTLMGARLDQILQRRGLVDLNVERGRSRYCGMMLTLGGALVLIAIAVMAAPIFWPAVTRSDWVIIAVSALFSALLGTWFVRRWLVFRWEWDDVGITYATGRRTTRLVWPEITQAKRIMGGWRLIGPQGSVSCWYHTTLGYNVIRDALVKHRPDFADVTEPRWWD